MDECFGEGGIEMAVSDRAVNLLKELEAVDGYNEAARILQRVRILTEALDEVRLNGFKDGRRFVMDQALDGRRADD